MVDDASKPGVRIANSAHAPVRRGCRRFALGTASFGAFAAALSSAVSASISTDSASTFQDTGEPVIKRLNRIRSDLRSILQVQDRTVAQYWPNWENGWSDWDNWQDWPDWSDWQDWGNL